ncbi:MAG: hypothetical protein AAGJ86_07695 [Pseudomonadota bacterium]
MQPKTPLIHDCSFEPVKVKFLKRLLPLVFLTPLILGCSFTITEVPPPDEFTRPIPEVLNEYPEMSRVFKGESGNSDVGMARIEPFIEKWGEPKSKSTSWWNLWPGNWLFIPQQVWIWELGDKMIQCRIDHPIYEGFKKTICNCQEIDNDST